MSKSKRDKEDERRLSPRKVTHFRYLVESAVKNMEISTEDSKRGRQNIARKGYIILNGRFS